MHYKAEVLELFGDLNSSLHVNCSLWMQVGTGARSEKIKTYNYKDSRVSDHRTKANFDLTKTMEGDLETSIQSMIAMDQSEQMAELGSA